MTDWLKVYCNQEFEYQEKRGEEPRGDLSMGDATVV